MYRFFFTLPKMNAPDGTQTNAAYGLARVLMRIIREAGDSYVVPAMESVSPTFRHEMFPEYKAHREKMPDRLREQIPIINEIFEALNLTPAQAEGFEADDLIGTMARRASEAGLDVEIITGDKDLLQLVDERVRVLLTRKGITDLEPFGPDEVRALMGVPPEHVTDLKALEGDKSDNIPGVPGVGEKTALDLLSKFDTVEDLYERLGEIDKAKLREKLEAGRDLAFLSKKLATIERNAPFAPELEQFSQKDFNRPALAALISKYAFRSLIKETGMTDEEMRAAAAKGALAAPRAGDLFGADEQPGGAAPDAPAQAPAPDPEFRCILRDNEAELIALIEKAKNAKSVSIDVETTGLDTIQDELAGISIAVEPGDAAYIPMRHTAPRADADPGDMFAEAPAPAADDPSARQLPPDRVLDLLRPLLEDESVAKLGHNLKFDWLMLKSAGIDTLGLGFDTMLASFLLAPDGHAHALKTLAGNMLGRHFKTYQDVTGKGKNQICFTEVPLDIATAYAANDVDVVLLIKDEIAARLVEHELTPVFEKIEMPLIGVLGRMEMNGVAVDANLLSELSVRMTEKESEIVTAVHKLTGRDTNLNSPKQVAELLFGHLGLPRVRKDSTDIQVLEELRGAHEAVPLIIEYRRISKLRGTYVDALPSLVKKKTGRIHTSFNQTGAATGRLSSSDPNLQNIPIRTAEGREIRRAFIPPDSGSVILAADYSQVEIRLLAHLCGDANLIAAFRNGEDIHTRTAAEVFGTPPDQVTSDQRRYAKTINFGIIYGMREFKLSNQLGISRREAAEFIDNYFARFPAVKDFVEETKNRLMLDGYVTTMFGRRRYFPEANSGNRNERDAALRAAVNTRIQGTAADIMKLAMIAIDCEIEHGRLPAKMILQVHDELVFEVRKPDVSAVAREVRRIMQTCMQPDVSLDVPLLVDVEAGPNWLDTDAVEA